MGETKKNEGKSKEVIEGENSMQDKPETKLEVWKAQKRTTENRHYQARWDRQKELSRFVMEATTGSQGKVSDSYWVKWQRTLRSGNVVVTRQVLGLRRFQSASYCR